MKRIALLLAIACLAASGYAGDYPSKNVTILVPYGAGGSTDLATRALLDCLPAGSLPSGVTFVVTNMPGGSGLVGTTRVANTRADGYTLCGLTGDFIYSSVRGATTLPVDTLKPLIWTQVDPFLILVKKDAPYQTFKELIEYMKANPGKIKLADSGPGAITHLVGVALDRAFGLDFNTIGYDNSLECVIAVVNEEAQVTVAHSTIASGQIRAGEVIPIAVSSKERSLLFPEVPSIAEVFPEEGKDINIISTMGVACRTEVPDDITDYLRKLFKEAVKTDAYKERMKVFQSQDISDWTDEDMVNLYDQLAVYYKTLAQ